MTHFGIGPAKLVGSMAALPLAGSQLLPAKVRMPLASLVYLNTHFLKFLTDERSDQFNA